MEYFSPFNGCPNGETNYLSIPAPPLSPRSQVVGEGDVTAVTWPNGTLQLYFVPARSYGNSVPWGVLPAWFIRTVPNLFSAPHSTPQPFAANHRDNVQSSNFYLSPNNAEESEEKIKYQIHFHNDKATSSTDLRYFCQPLPYNWYCKQSVETQASQHVKVYECCHCCKVCGCREPGQRAAIRDSAMSVVSETEQDKKSTHAVNTGSNTSAAQCERLCNNCKTKSNVYKANYI